MLIAGILATGVSQLEYTKWYALPTGHTILNAWDWWAKKVFLRLKFQKVADNMNRGMDYGMAAVDTVHKELDGVIEGFEQVHAATQKTLQTLSQEFPKLCA